MTSSLMVLKKISGCQLLLVSSTNIIKGLRTLFISIPSNCSRVACDDFHVSMHILLCLRRKRYLIVKLWNIWTVILLYIVWILYQIDNPLMKSWLICA